MTNNTAMCAPSAGDVMVVLMWRRMAEPGPSRAWSMSESPRLNAHISFAELDRGALLSS